ncbi:MAG: hypothetical protein GX621_15420 [Pirellulaceae bacterium]|nr:hypothetical protein [Pirellulaceae bacterium]
MLFAGLALFCPCVMAVDKGYSIPLIDLAGETERQVVVDREKGQYLGHPTTVLLEDNRTMICVYPKGHGKGALVMKRSADGGKTWSDRLPTPANWATSRETPTIHRVVDAEGKKRLIVWSGLYPARLAVSEDDGLTWTGLEPVGDWGGCVVMGFVEPLRTGKGHYLAMFHDDGRFIRAEGAKTLTSTLYKTLSTDGGLTWSAPEAVWQGSDIHLCEPGCIRSPDGKQLAVLLRENRRLRNSHVIFSNDEGKTWTEPRELPGALTGDRHTAKYAPDSRLFVSFRDTTLDSPTKGDWVGWVGTYDDIVKGREGQYRVRLMDNRNGRDCAYPGVEVLPDGTFVVTTYGHWVKGESPFIVSVRFTMDELDAKAAKQGAEASGDEKPSQKAADASGLPASVDLRDKFDQWGLTPRQQGRRPTCSVFTVVAALEFALARKSGAGTELSVEYLNWAANRVTGRNEDHGQFFHNLLNAYGQHGICGEQDMPYRRRFNRELAPSETALARAKELREAGLEIHWINPLRPRRRLTNEKFAEIKRVLAAGWPVGAGSSHSRLLVGYRDDPEQPGGGVFFTKDSAPGAYAEVTYEFVKTAVGDVFWIEAL